MHAFLVQAAVAAATSVASEMGLPVEDATVLQNSNRLAVNLLPCGVLARVAPVEHRPGAEFEVEVAKRIAATNAPVAELDSRVERRAYLCGEFVVTFWTYYEPVAPEAIAPAEYGRALQRLHAGLREIDLPAPHFMDR